MKADYILRRIHSFLGIIPLYFFLIMHIPHTSIPFITKEFTTHPYMTMLIMGVTPFLLHGLIGMYIIIKNRKAGRDTRNIGKLHRIQVLSSVILIIFIVSHIFLFKQMRYNVDARLLFYIITIFVFTLGIPALAFHIGYGTYTFCLSWGFLSKPVVRKTVRIISTALGFAFWVAVSVLYVFVFISLKGMLGL